jgi:hypothetical protein
MGGGDEFRTWTNHGTTVNGAFDGDFCWDFTNDIGIFMGITFQ